MHLSSLNLLTGLALATLGVLVFIPHDVVLKKIEPKHAKTGAEAKLFARGGNTLPAEEAYALFNKWVVHLRKASLVIRIEAINPKPERYKSTFPRELDDYSLGYGLYFRRPGFMLVNINNVLSGARKTKNGTVLAGHYVNYKEKDHHKPVQDESSSITYLPHILKDIKHDYTFPGPSLGAIRVTMTDFRDTFKPANGIPPYERYLDYPEEEFLPEIAKPTDQLEYCWVIMHNYFDGGQMGYNQYQWRYWPVRKESCERSICSFGPAYVNGDTRYPSLADEYKHPGRICEVKQDSGAPVMCHTENRSISEGGVFTLSDKKWKLGYWISQPIVKDRIPPYAMCSDRFLAVDLASVRDNLLNPVWTQNLDAGTW